VPRRPRPADELVEVVDPSGAVVEVVTRARMRAEHLRHRAVFVAVESSDGRVLVHRRSEDKDVWPGWWDLAVGGVVAAGEPWLDAARRELAEEVGLHGVDPELLSSGRYEDEVVRLVARVYRVVLEARFVTRVELDELVASRPFLPDSLALVLPLLSA
jgi:8-oxo-dGTP pyrophosphatase MutT (NUDIX family)